MLYSAIIVAGGTGLRMKSDTPKQFLLLNNKPILFYSIEQFFQFSNDIDIIVVLPKEFYTEWQTICKTYDFNIKHRIAEGGFTRFDSVKNALKLIITDGLVAIHDAARPLTTIALISQIFADAEKNNNSIPVIPVSDSIRYVDSDKNYSLERKFLYSVQTPQCFKTSTIISAYNQTYNERFTDDASVIESVNEKIHITPGDTSNIKITYPQDIILAQTILNNNS